MAEKGSQNDYLSQMVDMQKKFMNSWQDSFGNLPMSSQLVDMQKKMMQDFQDSYSGMALPTQFADVQKMNEQMMEAQKNMQEQMVSMQKQMMDTWQGYYAKPSFDLPFMGAMSNKGGWEEWLKTGQEFVCKNISSGSNGNLFKDILEKMVEGASSYSFINEFWLDMVKSSPMMDEEKISEFMEKWQDQYMSNLMTTFISVMPEPMKTIAKNNSDIGKIFFDITNRFVTESGIKPEQVAELMMKNPLLDRNTSSEYTKLWETVYKNSMGKLKASMIPGMAGENDKQIVDTVDAFIRNLNDWNEFLTKIYNVGSDTMNNIVVDIQGMTADGCKQPKSAKEFYEYWWRKNEDAYVELFATESFSKLLNEMAQSSFNFKKQFDDLVEKQYNWMPFVKNAEIEELYKTVYELKKEVRRLAKELKQTEQKVTEHSAPVKEKGAK